MMNMHDTFANRSNFSTAPLWSVSVYVLFCLFCYFPVQLKNKNKIITRHELFLRISWLFLFVSFLLCLKLK